MSTSNHEFESLLGGTAVVFVGFVAQTGLVFVLRVTVARYLSVEAFGLFALFMAMLNVAGLLSVAGLDVGIGRFLPRYERDAAERADVLRSALEVAVPLSIGLAVAIYLASGWIAGALSDDGPLRSLFVVAAVATPFFGLQRLALGAARGQERTVPKVVIENVLVPVSQLGLTVLVVVLGFQTLGIAWAYAGGVIVSGVIAAAYLLWRTPVGVGTGGTMHRRLATFSAPLVITGILFHLIHYLDTFLLGLFAATTDVGIYNTVYPLSLLVTVFLGSFGFLLLPAISGLEIDDRMDRADRLFKLTAKWIVFLTFPVFVLMFYFPGVTISATFGPKYVSGGSALSLLALGFLVHAGLGSTDKGLIAVGRTRIVMAGNVVAAIVNVGLNVLLIPPYGFLGAAVASVLAFWTLDLLWLIQLHRYTGIVPISRGLLRVVAISVPATAVLCVGTRPWVGGSIPGVLAVVLAAGLLHLFVAIRYGDLSDEEIAVIETVEGVVGRDLSPLRRGVLRLRH